MEDETQVVPTSEEQGEEQVEEQTEGTTEEEVDWKSQAEKAKELAENYKKRAEKAEKKAKESQASVNAEGLSQTDLLFLAKADIHEDDIGDVTTWAKNNNMSVREAYQQFKPVLDVRAEERKSAQATETKSPRGKKPNSGEDLLRKAQESGEVPENEADIQKLIQARLEARRKRR